MRRERRNTLVNEDACGYCGRGYPESVTLAADCAVPTYEILATEEAYQRCVSAPRFRWCARIKMLAAYLGPGAPPAEIPRTPVLRVW